MRVLLVVTVLVAICLLLTESVVLNDAEQEALQKEMNIYEAKIRTLYRMLVKECPSSAHRSQRQVDRTHPGHLEIQKITYARLLQELINCKKRTTSMTAKPSTPTTRAHTTPTTTTPVVPVECQQAVNYTQSWRRDHKGSDIKPDGPNSWLGYACDLHFSSSQWFRFSGAAGTHLLDSCLKSFSCGAIYPMWTDEKMPTAVGVEATVKVFGVYQNNCKDNSRYIKVMRCSLDSAFDLIYKQTTDDSFDCGQAFCGMM